jgi:hypothetical protein
MIRDGRTERNMQITRLKTILYLLSPIRMYFAREIYIQVHASSLVYF